MSRSQHTENHLDNSIRMDDRVPVSSIHLAPVLDTSHARLDPAPTTSSDQVIVFIERLLSEGICSRKDTVSDLIAALSGVNQPGMTDGVNTPFNEDTDEWEDTESDTSLYAETISSSDGESASDSRLWELAMETISFEEAEILYTKCLRIRNINLGWDDPNTQRVAQNLASVLVEREKIAEARRVTMTFELPWIIEVIMRELFMREGDEYPYTGLIDKPYRDDDIAMFFDRRVFPTFGTDAYLTNTIAIELIFKLPVPQDVRLVITISPTVLSGDVQIFIEKVARVLQAGVQLRDEIGNETFLGYIYHNESGETCTILSH